MFYYYFCDFCKCLMSRGTVKHKQQQQSKLDDLRVNKQIQNRIVTLNMINSGKTIIGSTKNFSNPSGN